jgi:hypothetical protein
MFLCEAVPKVPEGCLGGFWHFWHPASIPNGPAVAAPAIPIAIAIAAPPANVNPKVVSEMLGHANIAVTLDIYSHVLPDKQAVAAAAMEDALS